MKKFAIAVAAAAAFTSAWSADPVTGTNENVGTLAFGVATNVSDIERNTTSDWAFAGDGWIFTMPSGGTIAQGAAVPLNLTIGSSQEWVSSIQNVALYNIDSSAGFDQFTTLVAVAPNPILNPAPLSDGTVSFSFSPLSAGQTYGLLIAYAVGAQSDGGYIASITAVPEPGALVMAGLGLGVVGFLSRRRRQKA